MTKERTRLERLFVRIETRFPRTRAALYPLRQPWAIFIRVPLGFLLLLGGLLSFLPVLGIWMLPLGLLLLSIDLPFLQRPLNGLILRSERRWKLWRRKNRDRKALPPAS